MSRRVVLLLAVLAAFTYQAEGQQHQNLEKGFKPGQAYAFSDVDEVNLFNGNLNVSLPIGPTYKVGGNLSYGFTLAYAGNNWDYDQSAQEVRITDGPFQTVQTGFIRWAIPIRHNNAGMGWLFSMGRILSYIETRGEYPYPVYQSPDGAEHVLFPSLDGSAGIADVSYSRSGTYMRHKVLRDANGAVDGQELEFGDGTIKEFTAGGAIRKIRDRFGNAVNITEHAANAAGIPAPNATACGTSYKTRKVADPYRTHYLYYALTPGYAAFMPDRVCQASLAVYGGTANYLFTYVDRHISRQKAASPEPYYELDRPTPTVQVPLLTQVTLPYGTSYDLVYDIGKAQDGTGVRSDSTTIPAQVSDLADQLNPGSFSGHLVEMRMPTRGKYEWLYRRYIFPPDYESPTAPLDPEAKLPPSQSAGVWKRKKYVKDNDPDIWTYTSSFLNESMGRTVAVTTVAAPDGATTANYFSLWSWGGSRDDDYGLPYTRRPSLAGEDLNPRDGMYLSSRTTLPDGKKRVNYVRYEWDPTGSGVENSDTNRRVSGRLTVFEDQTTTKEVYSDFDGLGHYRTTTISASDGAVERVKRTNYNPTNPPNGERYVIPSLPWIIGSYDSVETTDRHPTTHATISQSKTEYCFDSSTGRLQRTRTLRGAVAGATDFLTVYRDEDENGQNVDGNVSQEDYAGGDQSLLPTGFNTCTGSFSTLTPWYRLHHTYSFGTLATTRYHGANFNMLDLSIEPSTGLPLVSLDSAGVAVHLRYDLLGRLTNVWPDGRAWSEYRYTEAEGTTGPNVVARQCPNGVTTCAGNPLTEAWYYYDLFGRMTQQRLRVLSTADTAEWATTWTEYEDGRQSAVSVVTGTPFGSAAPMPAGTKQTKWLYDILGRVTSVEQPDGAFTLFEYPNSRQTERSTLVALTTTTSDWVTTTETSDFLGRMVSVTEDAGPGKTNLTTLYKYDAGDRLIAVNDGEVAERNFWYDGAGMLTSEKHPENGITNYLYDSRGHAVKVRTDDCHFDLNYTYDVAERLVKVESRQDGGVTNCEADTWRPMKEFTFETNPAAADLGLGKLRSAARYNASAFGLVRVTETLSYGDDAGRVTEKQTAVEELSLENSTTIQTFGQSFQYDELDRIVDNIYPACNTTPCGQAPYDGLRTEYDERGVKSIVAGDYSSSGTFTPVAALATFKHAPNGLRVETAHANGVTEQVVPDPNGLTRPRQITFSGFSAACSAPSVTSNPVSQSLPYGGTVTLSVTAGGTAPFSYQWYEGTEAIPNATSSTFVTPAITAVRKFHVEVASGCGKVLSAEATLTPVANPPASLVATRQGTTSSISIQWTGSAGAAEYVVERRNAGPWAPIAITTAPSYVDPSCGTGAACAYRVRAITSGGAQSNPSNHDLATLITFTPVNVPSLVGYAHYEEVRAAVNAIRAAAGLTALSWEQIVPGNAPTAAGLIKGAHVLAMRGRMDEALQAHQIALSPYEDAVLTVFRFRHIEQLREKTQ
ncbi:MAG TPA: hypothetical protein VEX88_14920 [Glaciibacter sp.]|nr:hypothetical protein [Glaciibacter sp.]